MNEVEFNIRLYLTGAMRRLTDKIDNSGRKTPQRFVLKAMTELFNSLSDENIELIRLRYMERLTLAEIASHCHLNEATIRRHTNPTVKQVKEIIKKATEQAQQQTNNTKRL